MRLRPSSLLTLLAVVTAGTGAAAPSAPAAANGPLLPAVRKAAAELPAGGFVLAEITGDKVTFASAGRPGPRAGLVPERVLFEIGSITKVFTALLLAQTVAEGRASLDDPIAQHLPPDLTLAPSTAAITLGQLATHTSGLPRLPTNFRPANPADPYADYDLAKLYAFLRDYRPAEPAPRPAAYSNLGFGLLSHLLERIHGRTYAELLAQRITGPLGLRDTVITPDAEQRSRLAVPHSGSIAVSTWQLGSLTGAGAIRSTAADLARFAQALLAPERNPLTDAWALIREPRAPFGTRSMRIGLAIILENRGEDAVCHHSGGTGGFRTYLELVPSRRQATVLLLNNDTPEPAAVVASVRRPAATPPANDPRTRTEAPLDAGALAAYPGVYAIGAGGRFTVVLDEAGRLRARLSGQGFLPLFHAGQDRFFARAVAAEFQFHRDPAGAINALTLHQNGNEVPAQRQAGAIVPALRFPPAAELKAYAGRFQLAPQIVFEITPRGETLFVKLTGQAMLPVFCDAPDHFVYEAVPAALTFSRDAAGQVNAVTLHQNGRDQRAPRLPPASAPPANP
jgi:D-alanyl-D-alanine-carboxypeptidase/D-alanyl-D-alanine-endopeptidase